MSPNFPGLTNLAPRQDAPAQLGSPAKPTAGTDSKPTDPLLSQLAQRLPGLGASQGFKALAGEDFSPKKVAERITGFVAQGLEQAHRDGKSGLQVENLRRQALEGIQRGFEEARGILEAMGLLSEELASTIDRTQALTLKGVEGLQPQAAPEHSGKTAFMAAERYQSAESLSLKVRTRDGDEVTIHFNRASDYQAGFASYSDGQVSAATFSLARSESSHYRFSVEGELDEDEIDALQALIKDVNEIADDFFDGDIQAAFEQAKEFRLDTTELAAMSLRLSQSQSYSAASAYQQVQELDNPGAQQGRKLGHLINDFANRLASPALDFMQSPKGFAQELLQALTTQDLRFKDAGESLQERLSSNLDSLSGLLDLINRQAPQTSEQP
nr:DUF5610 domain-containing protein [Motiliproteus sp. SC1-56]